MTFWNGEPAECRIVRVIVADSGRFPHYGARDLVGQEREAVEVKYGGRVFYLDNEAYHSEIPEHLREAASEFNIPLSQDFHAGSAWAKVTTGHGSPQWGHRDLDIERIVE